MPFYFQSKSKASLGKSPRNLPLYFYSKSKAIVLGKNIDLENRPEICHFIFNQKVRLVLENPPEICHCTFTQKVRL